MAMKHHGIEMVGPFINQKVSSNPTYQSSDKGRMLYNTTDKKFYIADQSQWKEPTSGVGTDTPIPLFESNGDVYNDEFTTISGWSATGVGTGYSSTQSTFGIASCLRMYSGTTTGSNYARVNKVCGGTTLGKFTITARVYNSLIGINGDDLEFYINTSTTNAVGFDFNTKIGLRVIGQSGSTNFGADKVPMGQWNTITLSVNRESAGNEYCDVYVNGVLLGTNVPCNYTTSGLTVGNIMITQYGYNTANQLSYVDYIKVGTGLVQINANTTYGLNKSYKSWVDAGYASGGDSGAFVTTIDKLTFSNDNNVVITSGLSTARNCGGFNSYLSGYALGGNTAANVSTIDKLMFSSDANASITSGLTGTRRYISGFNSTTAGYSCGGYSTTFTSVIDKLMFSSDNNATIASGLVTAMGNSAGFESSTAGYCAGGYSGGAPYPSEIDKLTFSTEARTTLTSTLSGGRSTTCGYASTSAGYTLGGSNGTTTVWTIDKLTFSNDSNSSISSHLSAITSSGYGYQSSTAGYCAGAGTTTIDKLLFATDNNASIVSRLSASKGGGAGYNTL